MCRIIVTLVLAMVVHELQGVLQFEKRCTNDDQRRWYPHCDYNDLRQELWCDATHFDRVPVKQENSQCRYSKFLYLNISCVENINRGDFENFQELEYVDCSVNKIREIDLKNFTLPKLRHLDLSSNAINKINFEGSYLPNLTHINLINNKLTQFGNNVLDAVEWIALDSNQITYLSDKFCKSCGKLRYLSLTENRIEGIHQSAFDNLENLEVLRLDGNELSSFNNFPNLNLKVLSISHNGLVGIPTSITSNLRVLETLNLGNNLINTLPALNFSNLQNLSLYNNSIKTIRNGVFPENNSLVYINLEYNDMDEMHPDAFVELCHLKALLINNNSLKTPYASWFKHITNNTDGRDHEAIGEGNSWRCDGEIIQFYEFYKTLKHKNEWQEKLSITCSNKRFKNQKLGSKIFQTIKNEERQKKRSTITPTTKSITVTPKTAPSSKNCTKQSFVRRPFDITKEYRPPIPTTAPETTTNSPTKNTSLAQKQAISNSTVTFIVVGVICGIICIVGITVMCRKRMQSHKHEGKTNIGSSRNDSENIVGNIENGNHDEDEPTYNEPESVANENFQSETSAIDEYTQLSTEAHTQSESANANTQTIEYPERASPVGASIYGSQTIPKTVGSINPDTHVS